MYRAVVRVCHEQYAIISNPVAVTGRRHDFPILILAKRVHDLLEGLNTAVTAAKCQVVSSSACCHVCRTASNSLDKSGRDSGGNMASTTRLYTMLSIQACILVSYPREKN